MRASCRGVAETAAPAQPGRPQPHHQRRHGASRALEPTLYYSGIPRHADRQQIEFCILALIRVSRLLSALLPKRVHDARLIGRNLAMRSEH